jgi:hypothetical protein
MLAGLLAYGGWVWHDVAHVAATRPAPAAE